MHGRPSSRAVGTTTPWSRPERVTNDMSMARRRELRSPSPTARQRPFPSRSGGDDDNDIPGGRAGEHFPGSIDDVVLYSRALNPSGIAGVMNGIYQIPLSTNLEDWRQRNFGSIGNLRWPIHSSEGNHTPISQANPDRMPSIFPACHVNMGQHRLCLFAVCVR